MDDVVYFLVPKFKEQNVQQDFKKLMSWLGGQNIELVQEAENRYKMEAT